MIFTRKKHAMCTIYIREGVRRISSFLLGCVLAVALLSGGCGRNRGPERVVVSGTVTFKGEPVANGTIRFVPDPSSGMPTAGTVIKDGKYNAERFGGVPVGTHKVQIEAMRAVKLGPPAKPGEPVPLRSEGFIKYIPKKYNDNTQLEITIEPDSEEIVKNFDLTD